MGLAEFIVLVLMMDFMWMYCNGQKNLEIACLSTIFFLAHLEKPTCDNTLNPNAGWEA